MPKTSKNSPLVGIILLVGWILAGCSQTQNHPQAKESREPVHELAKKEVHSTAHGISQETHKLATKFKAHHTSGGGGGSSGPSSIDQDWQYIISCPSLNEMQIASLIESCEKMVEEQIRRHTYTAGCYKHKVGRYEEKDGSQAVLIKVDVNWNKSDQ